MLNTQISNKNEAEQEAQNLKSRGGAGVLLFENNYFVVVSCYKTEEDAKQVASSLSTEENTFAVKEQKISINIKHLEKEKQTILLKNLNFFTDKITEIYETANSLDSGSTSKISANLKIKSIKAETQATCDEMLKTDNQKSVKQAFLSFLSALEYASEQSHLSSTIVPYSSVLREMMIHSILSFCNI